MNSISIFSAVRPSLDMSFDSGESPNAQLSPRSKIMSKLAATRKFCPLKKSFLFSPQMFPYSFDFFKCYFSIVKVVQKKGKSMKIAFFTINDSSSELAGYFINRHNTYCDELHFLFPEHQKISKSIKNPLRKLIKCEKFPQKSRFFENFRNFRKSQKNLKLQKISKF